MGFVAHQKMSLKVHIPHDYETDLWFFSKDDTTQSIHEIIKTTKSCPRRYVNVNGK